MGPMRLNISPDKLIFSVAQLNPE